MTKIHFYFSLLISLSFVATDLLASTRVVYPGTETSTGKDSRNEYVIELLKLALSNYGDKYTLEQGAKGMHGLRQLYSVAEGSVDVSWGFTTEERESLLRPIRIPIDKGLIGWRIFLINKHDEQRFAKIQNLDDLKPLIAGQVHDWPDTAILKVNKLNLVATSTYLSTFPMLKKNRVDYFPRSIMEIWKELEEHSHYDLMVENTILINYPAAYYYFVNKDNPELAKDLEDALELMIKDGRFKEIFDHYHRERIERSNLKARRIFYLENPYLPKTAPLERSELWFHYPADSNS